LPLWSRTGLLHSLTLGADYKDYKDAQRFLGQDNNLPITYLPFSFSYDLSMAGQHGQTQIGLSSIFSLRNVVSDPDEFAAKRTGAKANFLYLKGDLHQTWLLSRGMNLLGRLSVQYAPDPLISNEQMAAGGADTVRGYPESAALGDRGLIGGVELHSPSLAGTWAPELNDLHVLGFAEGARLIFLEASAAQESRFNLASVGVGMRFRAWKQVSGSLDYARALHAAGGVESGDQRVHFRLGAEW
jgi:hemolysin activation/secretion protein